MWLQSILHYQVFGVPLWIILLCGLVGILIDIDILSHITGLQGLMGGFSIRHCSLLVALCFATAVHIVQDYTLGWF